MSTVRYWIASISKEHMQRGVSGSFIQVCHGKETPLKRMKKGDYLIIYSAKFEMEGNAKLQSFTAIGTVKDEEIYPFRLNEHFVPYRRNINFLDCNETSIIPLIDDLQFIKNKKSWGYPFRFGFFEIQEKDFSIIASKMLKNEIRR